MGHVSPPDDYSAIQQRSETSVGSPPSSVGITLPLLSAAATSLGWLDEADEQSAIPCGKFGAVAPAKR